MPMSEIVTLPDQRIVRALRTPSSVPELVGHSAAIGRIQEFVRRVAALDGSVLITAEAGADVESVARALHLRGGSAGGPFISVECGADGLDRMLFGERLSAGPTLSSESPDAPADLESIGSDSGIAAARGGTLFLQDVLDVPASTQARLARVARDAEVWIEGEPVATAIRFMASAAPGVDADVKHHRFRRDLYRRLSASRIDLPPLRARPDDVPVIACRLLDDCCDARDLPRRAFTQAALGLLAALSWPGNIAELRDVVERIVSGTREETIQVEQLLPALQLDRAPEPLIPSGTLREARQRFERDYIAAVLQHHGWRMADAAEALGIQRPNLYRKARQLGIPLARISE
jgi:DNA-binding NtrC family response regulator